MKTTVVKTKILHAKTGEPMRSVYVEGKGWFDWNTAFHVYNHRGNFAQLLERDRAKINFDKEDV